MPFGEWIPMDQKDIPTIIQTIINKQDYLLESTDDFNTLLAELEEKQKEPEVSRDFKTLCKLTKTWVKILGLWNELQFDQEDRQISIVNYIREAEKSQYIELNIFNERFDHFINNTSYLSLDAINISRFKELLEQFSFGKWISEEYWEKIEEVHHLVKDAQDFLKASQKSSREYRYYHLKYDMQLVGDDQLDEIKDLEYAMTDIKEGEYTIPEDRQRMIIHKLVKDFSGKKNEQKVIIEKLKTYKPLVTSLPVEENAESEEGARLFDF